MDDPTPDDASTPPTPSSPSTASTAPAPAPAAADEEWDEADSILSWKLLVAIAVVLGVLGLGAMVVLNGRKADTNASTTGTDKAGGGQQNQPAVRDQFDRADNSAGLGKARTGEDWEAVSGTWGVKEGKAYISVLNDKGPRNLAVVDIGSGDGSVQATASKFTDGWGLVFRYRGPNAYWYIAGSASAKTFNVFKVKDGKSAKPDGVENIGLVKGLEDGTTIKVEFVGPTITVFVNGSPVKTFTDSYLQTQGTKAGLIGEGKKVADARWSEFVALKGLDAPSVTAPERSTTSKPKASSSTTTAGEGAPSTTGGGQASSSTTKATKQPGAGGTTVP